MCRGELNNDVLLCVRREILDREAAFNCGRCNSKYARRNQRKNFTPLTNHQQQPLLFAAELPGDTTSFGVSFDLAVSFWMISPTSIVAAASIP
jgi:hypothetical protein